VIAEEGAEVEPAGREAVCGDEFDVLTASSGTEALALMRTHEVAVVVTDQRMLNFNGETGVWAEQDRRVSR